MYRRARLAARVRDARRGDRRPADAYGVEPVPRLFKIDKVGRLAYLHTRYSEDSLPLIVEAKNALLRAPGAYCRLPRTSAGH